MIAEELKDDNSSVALSDANQNRFATRVKFNNDFLTFKDPDSDSPGI